MFILFSTMLRCKKTPWVRVRRPCCLLQKCIIFKPINFRTLLNPCQGMIRCYWFLKQPTNTVGGDVSATSKYQLSDNKALISSSPDREVSNKAKYVVWFLKLFYSPAFRTRRVRYSCLFSCRLCSHNV